MAANKSQRMNVLRSTFIASEADVVVPADCMPVPQFRIEFYVPPMRGYVAGECVDEAQLRAQAQAGRELMKEMLPC
jgi:hypothetical protein